MYEPRCNAPPSLHLLLCSHPISLNTGPVVAMLNVWAVAMLPLAAGSVRGVVTIAQAPVPRVTPHLVPLLTDTTFRNLVLKERERPVLVTFTTEPVGLEPEAWPQLAALRARDKVRVYHAPALEEVPRADAWLKTSGIVVRSGEMPCAVLFSRGRAMGLAPTITDFRLCAWVSRTLYRENRRGTVGAARAFYANAEKHRAERARRDAEQARALQAREARASQSERFVEQYCYLSSDAAGCALELQGAAGARSRVQSDAELARAELAERFRLQYCSLDPAPDANGWHHSPPTLQQAQRKRRARMQQAALPPRYQPLQVRVQGQGRQKWG